MLRFLSTLSLRRATGAVRELQCILGNFYPRSPCGERLFSVVGFGWNNNIHFYPRSPCGERPIIQKITILTIAISIHALLAESDRLWTILYSCPGNFYPRSPCGERPRTGLTCGGGQNISIHALLAESDGQGANNHRERQISIHALLAESDVNEDRYGQQYWRFLSTLSLRRATGR